MTYIDMIQAITDIIKQKVESTKEKQDSPLTLESAQAEEKVIKQAISVIGTAWYKAYLESRDRHEPSIIVDGEEYRLKGAVEKEYLTFFGPMVLSRNLYQNASDTKSYIPLEAAWEMTGEFMTVGVREKGVL